ncbi:MAG: hypothetical protein F4X80_04090 [Chloroflexi bacterium]|nr:hypothetical protein [Chloroflexota bacterium]
MTEFEQAVLRELRAIRESLVVLEGLTLRRDAATGLATPEEAEAMQARYETLIIENLWPPRAD